MKGLVLYLGIGLALAGCSTAQKQAAVDQGNCLQTAGIQCAQAEQTAGTFDQKKVESCALAAAISCIAQHPILLEIPTATVAPTPAQ